MKRITIFALVSVAAIIIAASTPRADAQISISIGAEPACPYGYYDYAPYSCVPYGYYGPEWFNGRVFIGAGPWFHGSEGFRGHVNNSFDPQHGYKGHVPNNGEKATKRDRAPKKFNGNEERDGRGHAGGDKH